jgi:pimeloyl-ACP methyl ester carboxylesterase
LIDDPQQSDPGKLSLAISGWMVGAGNATDNPGLAESLCLARALVIEYLQTPLPDRRNQILSELEAMEGGAVQYLDLIVKHILPPLAPSASEITFDKPMEISIEFGKPPQQASYLIQLPPQYDPWRDYPCIVTLGASTDSFTTPEAQIDWWCGAMNERFGIRSGHASRHGYIVIAPRWTRPNQQAYEYSEQEHAIVLKSLRDAIRRFSIDPDRVFLSGHFEGGTAAWDIGQSHPDHWAGVIPISARAGKYINHTYKNGKSHMAWYFINGGRDFMSRELNANVWNKRMLTKEYQTIIVLFRGRGTEKFADELPNLFTWMSVQSRRPAVEAFECSTLRPWNNYFWWLELELNGNPKMVAPEVNWDTAKRDDWAVEGERKSEQNTLKVRGIRSNSSAVVWMSPENVDFSRDVQIDNTGRNFDGEVRPSRRVILEDVRTRGDRKHAWWARADFNDNNWSIAE